MKTVVIGGGGHIGTYLVPMLVRAGHQVINVSRGKSRPYRLDSAWNEVEQLIMERSEESAGVFEQKIAALNPDIVIDLITFEVESTWRMTEALKNTNLSQYLFCSSIWAHGHATVVPATEDLPRRPIEDYGRKKAACEAYLHEQYRKYGFPETVVMPGHITGPGWNCINPTGNYDPEIFAKIGRGEEICLPNLGMETLHHAHAEDVAQVFMKSIIHRGQALGESFHATAPAAITMLGLAEAMYDWFGREPRISYLPWKEWCEDRQDAGFINSTWNHITHSDNYSIEKGKKLIDYQPRYTIVQAVTECVQSMLDRGVIQV